MNRLYGNAAEAEMTILKFFRNTGLPDYVQQSA